MFGLKDACDNEERPINDRCKETRDGTYGGCAQSRMETTDSDDSAREARCRCKSKGKTVTIECEVDRRDSGSRCTDTSESTEQESDHSCDCCQCCRGKRNKQRSVSRGSSKSNTSSNSVRSGESTRSDDSKCSSHSAKYLRSEKIYITAQNLYINDPVNISGNLAGANDPKNYSEQRPSCGFQGNTGGGQGHIYMPAVNIGSQHVHNYSPLDSRGSAYHLPVTNEGAQGSLGCSVTPVRSPLVTEGGSPNCPLASGGGGQSCCPSVNNEGSLRRPLVIDDQLSPPCCPLANKPDVYNGGPTYPPVNTGNRQGPCCCPNIGGQQESFNSAPVGSQQPPCCCPPINNGQQATSPPANNGGQQQSYCCPPPSNGGHEQTCCCPPVNGGQQNSSCSDGGQQGSSGNNDEQQPSCCQSGGQQQCCCPPVNNGGQQQQCCCPPVNNGSQEQSCCCPASGQQESNNGEQQSCCSPRVNIEGQQGSYGCQPVNNGSQQVSSCCPPLNNGGQQQPCCCPPLINGALQQQQPFCCPPGNSGGQLASPSCPSSDQQVTSPAPNGSLQGLSCLSTGHSGGNPTDTDAKGSSCTGGDQYPLSSTDTSGDKQVYTPPDTGGGQLGYSYSPDIQQGYPATNVNQHGYPLTEGYPTNTPTHYPYTVSDTPFPSNNLSQYPSSPNYLLTNNSGFQEGSNGYPPGDSGAYYNEMDKDPNRYRTGDDSCLLNDTSSKQNGTSFQHPSADTQNGDTYFYAKPETNNAEACTCDSQSSSVKEPSDSCSMNESNLEQDCSVATVGSHPYNENVCDTSMALLRTAPIAMGLLCGMELQERNDQHKQVARTRKNKICSSQD